MQYRLLCIHAFMGDVICNRIIETLVLLHHLLFRNLYIVLCFLLSINIHIVPVRLVGTSSHNYGRVEVYYNGEWGTVCDDGWGTADATVVCRQLGFYSWVNAYRSAYYGQGTGPIWLSKLSCFGNESNLFECAQLNSSTKNCTHSDDAAVQCYYYGRHRIRRKYLVNSCLILQNIHKLLNDRSTN